MKIKITLKDGMKFKGRVADIAVKDGRIKVAFVNGGMVNTLFTEVEDFRVIRRNKSV